MQLSNSPFRQLLQLGRALLPLRHGLLVVLGSRLAHAGPAVPDPVQLGLEPFRDLGLKRVRAHMAIFEVLDREGREGGGGGRANAGMERLGDGGREGAATRLLERACFKRQQQDVLLAPHLFGVLHVQAVLLLQQPRRVVALVR